MRTLYLTFERPSKFYGGGRAIIQSLESISTFSEIDYVGLDFDKEEFGYLNIRNTWFIEKKKHIFSSVKNMLFGLPTFYYGSWKRIMKSINFADYDYAFIEFSHLDFAVKLCKKNNLKVITRVHNIESDMVRSVAKSKTFSMHKVRAVLNGRSIFKRERRDFEYSDKIIFLTEEDKNRANSIYKRDYTEKSIIVPICMNLPDINATEKALDYKYILATGSLNYGANAEGISWLIKDVWTPLAEKNENCGVKLVIAGSNPTGEMIELCKNTPECVLVDTPKDIAPYLKFADFYLAPIFVGAGMKVKVAEALAFGKKIVGTDHAFIGYDKAENYLYRANTAEEFKTEIKSLLNRPDNSKDCETCRSIFIKEFSMDVSKHRYKNVVFDLLNLKD